MAFISPFTAGRTQTISVTNSSAATQLTNPVAPCLEITNSGSVNFRFAIGDSAVTASATTSPIVLAGQTKIYTIPGLMSSDQALYIALIAETAAGSTAVVTTGAGN